MSEDTINRSLNELIDAAKDACRFLDYFAHGKTFFEGGGMPVASLERLQAAISVVQDEENCVPATPEMAKRVDIVNAALKRIGDVSSEISVVDDEVILEAAFSHYRRRNKQFPKHEIADLLKTLKVQGYLATREPVAVSLEKVRLAICAFEGKDPNIWSYKGMAKAALDAAGVKYVD